MIHVRHIVHVCALNKSTLFGFINCKRLNLLLYIFITSRH